MEVTGMIICQEYYDFRGGIEHREYRWEGGELAQLKLWWLTNRVYRPGEVFTLGSLRLRVVDDMLVGPSLVVARDGWHARLRYAVHHSTKWIDKIYRHLIVTAAVWGLADYNDALLPSWRDVHFLKRFARGIDGKMRHG
jgi:hypothetical protein